MTQLNEHNRVLGALLAEPIVTPPRQQPIGAAQARAAVDLALRLGDPAAAEHGARTLLRVFPNAIALAILLGRALLDQGDHAGAVEQFRQALARNPLEPAAWLGLAGALSVAGQSDEARVALGRAALHDPLDSDLLTPGVAKAPAESVGVVYLRRGHPQLAVAELAAALARDARRDDLRLYYAEALRRSGDSAGAAKQLALLAGSEPRLPILLLRAALTAGPAHTAELLQECSGYDPDWQLTRRFFAPELPPWSLPPAPALPWSAAFEPLAPYLSHAAGPKSAPQAPSLPAARPAQHPPAPADPDVLAYVATTERLRHRLAAVGGGPRPLVPMAGERRPTQALLGCKATLRRRYGDDGFAAIDRRLHALADALRRRGVETYCCYLDDGASLRIGDQAAISPTEPEPERVRELVRNLGGALAEQRHELGTLLLIGGDDSVPFHRLPNPIHDDDEAILSDTPYGSDDAGYVLPQRIVARLPDADGGDPSLLLDLLDQMIDHHAGRGSRARYGASRLAALGLRRASAPQARAASAGYSAEIWRGSSREVLDVFDASAPLASCPPTAADTLRAAEWDGHQLLYVNLHGASGLPNWYGQPDANAPGAATKLPIALRPEQLGDRRLAGGLLISEACYGADLAGRTAATSIPLRALAEGALACVASTVNAYGSISGPLLGADLLCQRLLAHLAAGVPIGEALRQARLELAQTMYRRQGYLDDVDTKTLTEFVLLGDPWATLGASGAPASWPVSKVAGIERVPKPRPKAVLDEAQIPRELLRRAREALRKVLPDAALASLYIVAQPGARAVRKGDAGQELVISAHDRRATADGHQIGQTALVTLSGQAVMKVALTR